MLWRDRRALVGRRKVVIVVIKLECFGVVKCGVMYPRRGTEVRKVVWEVGVSGVEIGVDLKNIIGVFSIKELQQWMLIGFRLTALGVTCFVCFALAFGLRSLLALQQGT